MLLVCVFTLQAYGRAKALEVEAQGIARSQIIKAKGSAEAETIAAEGALKAAQLLEQSPIAKELAKIDRTGAALGDRCDSAIFGST